MPIRYINNDPHSDPFLETVTVPLPGRAGQLARYSLAALAPEQVYGVGSPEFVDWQCREAALRTLAAWERVSGPLRYWRNDQRSMPLLPRRGAGMGASYERSSVGFDYWPAAAPTLYVGASTDAVSHEVGHAILDSLRPELWESLFGEVAGFHEGFADCMSLLVALFDDDVVAGLFATAPQPRDVLQVDSAAGQVAESVAAAVKTRFGAQHPASRPRRLKNTLQWAIPTTLPPNPTPTNLSREPHSFGRVFAGCFYDCIENIYRNVGPHTAPGLQNAAAFAGRLLATAVTTAPEEIRFFRAIGRAMIQAIPVDAQPDEAAYHLPIRDAFAAHNVALGSSALLAPTMGLEGPSPLRNADGGRSLNPRTRRDLIRHAGSQPGVRVFSQALKIGGRRVVRAALRQRLRLRIPDGMEVVARVNEEVLLGTQQHHCVVLGGLPNRHATDEEVSSFVEALADCGALNEADHQRTHGIRKRGKRRILRRLRFCCTLDHCN